MRDGVRQGDFHPAVDEGHAMSGPTNGRVTVVIPTHNRADLLTCAIESVLSQTAADRCDIVVVDDGSTDQTPEVAARLRAAGSLRAPIESRSIGGPPTPAF